MLLSLSLFKDFFLELETVCFTALIFTEYVMTLTEVEHDENLF
jgi:hypothetical protein